MLTAKQTVYVESRIGGMRPSEAYRAAYNCGRMSSNAIHVEAARLEKHPTVSLRLAQVNEKVVTRLERTAADISRVAWSIAEDEEAPPSARIAALNLEARRFAEYSEKHDVTVSVRAQMLQLVASLPEDELRAAKALLT